MPLLLHRRGALQLLAASSVLGLGGLGCQPKRIEPVVKPGMYQNSPQELQRLWSDILRACQRDERPLVHELMASFTMTPEELATLLGPAQAQSLAARYRAMMGSLSNAGAVELVAHVYEKKYDDIAVNRMDDQPASEQSDTDRSVQKALLAPRPFYTVRVKKKTETRGLRYEFFVYLNGFWRSGNLIGKFLPPAPAPAAAPESAPAAAPAAVPAAPPAAPAPSAP